MKCQDLFSLKNNNKKLLSAAVVIGALRVNIIPDSNMLLELRPRISSHSFRSVVFFLLFFSQKTSVFLASLQKHALLVVIGEVPLTYDLLEK